MIGLSAVTTTSETIHGALHHHGQSNARSVLEYLDELPAERRETLQRVNELVKRYLPAGYGEAMSYGMIAYQVPLSRYPDTYNGKPLAYVALAAQKTYNSLYLTGVYQESGGRERLKKAFDAAGKKFDVGQSCVRFRELDDLPLEAIGKEIASMPVEDFIASHERGRKRR